MKCEVCGKGVPEVILLRQNPKGEIGIWRCPEHNAVPQNVLVREITQVIHGFNVRGRHG